MGSYSELFAMFEEFLDAKTRLDKVIENSRE